MRHVIAVGTDRDARRTAKVASEKGKIEGRRKGDDSSQDRHDSPVRHIRLDLRVAELATDEPLEREHGVGRVNDRLPLRGETDETLAMLRERDNRGCCPRTLGVLNHLRRLALHDGDAGICRAKINTDNGALGEM